MHVLSLVIKFGKQSSKSLSPINYEIAQCLKISLAVTQTLSELMSSVNQFIVEVQVALGYNCVYIASIGISCAIGRKLKLY